MNTQAAIIIEEKITVQRTGEVIVAHAIVTPHPSGCGQRINYSHTFKPFKTAGFWYSDSMTRAASVTEAHQIVSDWFERLKNAFTVSEW